jgi:hypothetical protein
MWTALPSSEYYGGSATPRAPRRTSRLADRHQRPVARGALPTFTMIRLTGSTVGFTPAAPPAGNRSVPPATRPGSMSQIRRGTPTYTGVFLAADDQSARFQLARCDQGASTTASRSLCLSVSLARARASGSTARPLRCRAAPTVGPPASPGRCISPGPASQPARMRVAHIPPLLSHGASWRTIDSHGFVDSSVRFRLPRTPSRVSVSVSSIPSRSEPAAPG